MFCKVVCRVVVVVVAVVVCWKPRGPEKKEEEKVWRGKIGGVFILLGG